MPTPDFETFAAIVLPWLAGEPVGHNVLSTVVDGRTIGKRGPERDGAWLIVADGADRVIGVATVTPPGGALLSMMGRTRG